MGDGIGQHQFDIVGARMLSGYTSGNFAGDAGWVVRGELGRTPDVVLEGA